MELSELSLNALHEKLAYWVWISNDWASNPSHISHQKAEEIKKEIRDRGVKIDTYTTNSR